MSIRQRVILAVVAVILTVQLIAQVVGTDSTLYPFVPYPMYSWAHAAGSRFSVNELRIVSPESSQSRVVRHSDLDIKYFVFLGLVDEASRVGGGGRLPEGDDAARLLSRHIAEREGTAWSKAQIWERSFEIGEHGLLDRDPPMKLAREWSVPYPTTDARE